MCGIAGFSGDFDGALLARMAEVQRHRGPDDQGIEFLPEAGIGLAHRRLSIIDLSPAGHQPMWDDDRAVAITYNGELYNFRELRKELESDGVGFRSTSDTEVLLKLYLRDGEAMLERLNGIFAFAIWDSRERALFLARDHLGIKPLYTAKTPAGFLFASELKAILQDPRIDRELDPEAVDYHLHYLWCPSPHTMIRAVRKLPPGGAMTVRNGRIERQWQYWDLPYDAAIHDDRSIEEASEGLHDTIGAAVRRQMVADVPVGAFLSGGLDSSAIASFACDEVDPATLQCFTIGFEDDAALREGMGADLAYAEEVAKHLGVPLDTVWVGPEMVEQLPKMLFHLDEPQGDPAPINAMFICERARERGIKVLLSGAGGDDLLTGYRRHTALRAERYWTWLPAVVRAGVKRASNALPLSERTRRIRKALQYADRSPTERLPTYFDWAPVGLLDGVYSPDIERELARHDSTAPLDEAIARLPASTPELNKMLYLEGKFFLADHNLNYTDKTAMSAGVEVRVPLIDLEVVDYASRLPVRFKQHGTTGKWIFRKAMEKRLPRNVLYRSKAGFGAPLRSWLRGPLADVVEQTLSARAIRDRGLFDPAAIARITDSVNSGQSDAAYLLFELVCIELWCRMFVDPPTPSQSAVTL